jgi:hypothetical protein
MEQVIRLLKGRKAAAKLELSYCEEGNEHYDKVRKERTEEIKQLDKSLLILSSVVVPKGTLCEYCGEKLKEGTNLDYCKNDYCTQ